jgi:hypothetical protein
MIQDETLKVLVKERQELIKRLDNEDNQEKSLFYEEQLQALDKVILQRKEELLSVKNFVDYAETKPKRKARVK